MADGVVDAFDDVRLAQSWFVDKTHGICLQRPLHFGFSAGSWEELSV